MKLLELNVINIPAIEAYAEGFLPNIEFEPAKKWFQKSVRNLLINDEKFNTRIAQVSPTAPEWMKQRYKENVPLYRFTPSGDVTNKLNHIVDWLNSVYQVSQEKVAPNAPKAAARQQLVVYATKLLNSINSIDMKTLLAPKTENVKHHVDDWFDTLNKFVAVTGDHQEATTTEDMQHIIDYDNGAWVELKSDRSLNIEGKLMGHCVGGYGYKVKNGSTRIFSLRDNDNQPHVTVEVSHDEIAQVKGKGNRPPVKKYVQYVQDFLNKMHFPPTGGYNSMGARDIKQIGLLYNAQSKTYGTLKDIAKVVYTTPDGYQILTIENKEASSYDKPEYYIWKNEAMCGTIRQSYGDNFSIDLNEDREEESKPPSEEDRKIFLEGMDFLNSAFQKFELSSANRFGFYKIPNDNKYHDINQIPVAKEFTSNIIAKEVEGYRNGSGYLFLLPGFVSGNNYAPILFTLRNGGNLDNERNYKEVTTIDKPVFEKEFAEFLNEIKYSKQTTGYDNDRYEELIKYFNIVLNGNTKTFQTFNDAQELVANFGTAKITKVKVSSSGDTYGEIYRLLDAHSIIAEWKTSNNRLRNIDIMSDAFRKYVKPFVNFLNEKNIGLGDTGYSGRSQSDIKKYLKDWGINKRGDKWSTGKSSGIDDREDLYQWTFEKVGKLGNVVNPEGKRVGKIKFNSAKYIDEIRVELGRTESDEEKEENKKNIISMYTFLSEYCKKNGITISHGALPSNAKNFGFFIKDSKLEKINDVYPPEDVVSENNMIWKKKAMVTNDDSPTSGYKYGLYVDNKLMVKLSGAEGNDKEIIKVTIRNPNYSAEADENGHNNRNNEKTLPFNETNIAPYVDVLSQLFKKEGLTAKNNFLSSAGLQLNSGELKVATDDPKIRGFVDGLIQYEDGKRWKRRSYDRDEWELEAEDTTDGSWDTILRCKVTDEGITSINVSDKEARKRPSTYRPYLNDMLDLVEQMNAVG